MKNVLSFRKYVRKLENTKKNSFYKWLFKVLELDGYHKYRRMYEAYITPYIYITNIKNKVLLESMNSLKTII